MRTWSLMPMVLLLSACFGGTARLAVSTHDLSPARTETTSGQAGVLRQIEVQGPSWLDTPAMQYRLSYADRTRREAYAASRWAASPARLLEHKLGQRLLGGAGAVPVQAGGCRLRVELNEFVQDFVKPESSQAVIEARVSLLAPRSDTLLARRDFRVVELAGRDAPGGVVAMEAAARRFGDEIENWLRQSGSETLKHCGLG